MFYQLYYEFHENSQVLLKPLRHQPKLVASTKNWPSVLC